jgi:hypothetical protein
MARWPLDPRIAAEALGLFTHIAHRQHQPVCQPRGIRNAGGLAAGHHIQRFEPHLLLDQIGGHVHQAAARAREGDQLAAIHIDRAFAAAGQREGVVRPHQDRLGFKKNACRNTGGVRLHGAIPGDRLLDYPAPCLRDRVRRYKMKV